MDIEPICPVCGKPLVKTDIGRIYYCTRRQPTAEEAVSYAIIDATIKFDEFGKVLVQIIEIPPYTFTIYDNETGQRTRVREIRPDPFYINRISGVKDILDVKAVMNLPWHDREEVLRRLKIYLLFS